jgi:DNA polymerase-3 subunit gamma/tau
MAPKQPEAVGMSPAAKPDRMDKPMAAAAQMTDRHPMAEPPPWEDWPDTTDYADQGSHAAASGHTEAPAPALRSLPVREASEPSARVDIPRQTTPTAVETTPEGSVWLEAVQGLMAQEAITALVRELALQSQLLARDAEQWHLRVERETLNHAASRERLQAALLAAGHGDVKLHIEIGPVTDSPAKRLAVLAAAKMVAAQELIQSDPLVQAMVRDFGARIVPGSIQLI